MAFPTPLTPFTLQIALQAATLAALGLAPTAYDKVRVAWQQQGQPAPGINDDVVILRAVEEDTAANKTRDVGNYHSSGWQIGQWASSQGWGQADPIIEVTTYMRTWRVYWTLYGPNSFDNARILRSSLFKQATHDTLAKVNLYNVPHIMSPRRVPELFESQWWERVDFDALFNEAVYETVTATTVTSVEVILENERGVVADVTLSSS